MKSKTGELGEIYRGKLWGNRIIILVIAEITLSSEINDARCLHVIQGTALARSGKSSIS